MGNRQDNAYITASITDGEGVLSLGVFDGRTGGQVDSAAVSYPRAGIAGHLALGGRTEVTPVVISRIYDSEAQAYIARLRRGAGKVQMQVAESLTDDEGNVLTSPTTQWTGVLKMVHVSDVSQDANAAQTLEIEMTVEGVPTTT